MGISKKTYNNILNHTDLWNWYCISYGEKCYAFAVVSAYPVNDYDHYPKGGGWLESHPEKENVWLSKDGVEMYIDEFIVTREEQNGDIICQFIAEAYTYIFKKELKKII
jgi:hypothetical protein